MAEETPKKNYRAVKRAERKFSATDDAALIAESRVYLQMFKDDMAAFTAKDPSLNSAFADQWQKLIEDTVDTPTDEQMVDEIESKYVDVKEDIAKSMAMVREIEFYVDKAFPDDERLPYVFGFALIQKEASAVSLKFILQVYVMLDIGTEYETELFAAGLNPALPAQLATEVDDTVNYFKALEMAKRMRVKTTSLRVKRLNNLYENWRSVNKAAHLIYMHQPEKLKPWLRSAPVPKKKKQLEDI